MALPTGTITMNDVNIELGRSSGGTISLNDSDVRQLAGRPSGTISMNDLRGKSAGPRGYWYVLFSPGRGRLQETYFELSFSNAGAFSSWEMLQFPWYNTQNLYPPGWNGGPAISGSADSSGNIFFTTSNRFDSFWYPAPRGNFNDFYIFIGGWNFIFSVGVENVSNTSTNGGFWFDNT